MPNSPAPEGMSAEIWAILFEDPDHEYEVFTSEHSARKRFAQCQASWTCQLLAPASEVDRLTRRAAGLEAALVWRPFSEAPQDGSEILYYRPDCGIILIRYVSMAEFLSDSELEKYDKDTQFKKDWFYADFIHGGRLEDDHTGAVWKLPDPPSALADPESALAEVVEQARRKGQADALDQVAQQLMSGLGDVPNSTLGQTTREVFIPIIHQLQRSAAALRSGADGAKEKPHD